MKWSPESKHQKKNANISKDIDLCQLSTDKS